MTNSVHGRAEGIDPPPEEDITELDSGFPNEKALVAGIRAGNDRALLALGKVLSQRFVPVFTRRCGNHHNAEEIVNDAAVNIITKIDSYRSSKGSFWSWVFTIIERKRIDRYRRDDRRDLGMRLALDDNPDMVESVLYQAAPTLFGSDDEEASPPPSPQIQALRKGLEQISDRDRALLETFYGGVSDRQVAEELGINPDNVRKYRSLARKRLEEVLKLFSEFQEWFGEAHGGEASPAIPHPLPRRE